MNFKTMLMMLACGAALMGCGDDDKADDSAPTDDSAATCDFTATCATFCADATATCGDVWTDAAACETECAAWADGCDGDTDGDSLGCRTYHLGAAASDAATHCPHTGADGGGVCVD